jgi:hypothetical protein
MKPLDRNALVTLALVVLVALVVVTVGCAN